MGELGLLLMNEEQNSKCIHYKLALQTEQNRFYFHLVNFYYALPVFSPCML